MCEILLIVPSLLARYDFYIVSQAVRSGSVAPTHYNVIHDTSGLKPDHMQRLAYKLCHMYYNWQVCLLRSSLESVHNLAFVCLLGISLSHGLPGGGNKVVH